MALPALLRGATDNRDRFDGDGAIGSRKSPAGPSACDGVAELRLEDGRDTIVASMSDDGGPTRFGFGSMLGVCCTMPGPSTTEL